MKMLYNIDLNDIHFLQNQFSSLTDSKNELSPVDYIEKVRYLPSELTPMPGKYNYSCHFRTGLAFYLYDKKDCRKPMENSYNYFICCFSIDYFRL